MALPVTVQTIEAYQASGGYNPTAPLPAQVYGNNTSASGPMSLVPLTVPLTNSWGLCYSGAMGTDNAGEPVFDVDSFVEVKFADVAKVSSFPVENGGFAAYNKVVEAYQPKIKLAVKGQLRILSFLRQLALELRSTNLYNIWTPENYYVNVTLEKYDYQRTAKGGLTLLVAELTFIQVVQVTPQYATATINRPKKAGDAGKEVNGKNQPSPNITAQLDTYYATHGGNGTEGQALAAALGGTGSNAPTAALYSSKAPINNSGKR